ncbi:bifunctional hydroxymethylpyrimidine kinase/phosphomethylpyrimidine kinase [SAR202 cluster bacterium AC-409-J13_OGT_754m]|nr:bifunctional hydroxymethylpyrimidine kinase/phosphomethylpyrimidine kinase [SAR202 cluster bacterium AC-409-J13_OGT_754m]
MVKVMTIAGSDSGAGAGIQADLKTFHALGVYGTSVITAVTAQNTLGVTSVLEMPTGMVIDQMDAILTDINTDAVKIGMMANMEIIRAVVERLAYYGISNVVLDPVMIAKGGDRLLRADAVDAMRDEMFPFATVVTPNIPEAEILAQMEIRNNSQVRRAAEIIVAQGANSIVLKGGHFLGDAVDVFYDGEAFIEFVRPRVNTRNSHGTGCTFSSAIAAGLGKGFKLDQSIEMAKEYVTRALMAAKSIGQGYGPLEHFFKFDIQ